MDYSRADSSHAFRYIIILLEIATQFLANDLAIQKEKKLIFVDKMLQLLHACVDYSL